MINHIRQRNRRDRALRRVIRLYGWHAYTRITTVMEREHKTWKQLKQLDRDRLLEIRGLGRVSVNAIMGR